MTTSRTYGIATLPTYGLYVPVPAIDDVGGPLVIDMEAKGYRNIQVQIMCEITSAQASSADIREGVYYCFVKSATTPMVALPGDYQTSASEGVPDAIGIGFAARETVPPDAKYLLLLSRTALTAEVRIRAI